MKLTWLGHSCFKIEENGFTLILDPYSNNTVPGYRDLKEEADMVLCSHGHGDHCAADLIEKKEGAEDPFTVETIDTWHDEVQGAKRGPNKITVITDKDGVKVIHMGDIGCDLTDEQYAALQGADALMIPVGGFYTVEPALAKKMADRIGAAVTIPMHYRGINFGYPVIAELNDFADLCADIQLYGSSLEITKGMMKQTAIMVPQYAPGR